MYHFFLWYLSDYVKNTYKIAYNYARHDYFLYKSKNNKVYDSITIIRTSEKCFRVSLFYKDEFLYKSFKSPVECAKFVNEFVEDNK